MFFFDSHAHYNDEKFDEDREEIIKAIRDAGIEKTVVAGYSVESSKKSIEIAKTHEGLFSSIGISPNDLGDSIDSDMQKLQELIPNTPKEYETNLKNELKIVAIGEIGLDYYWNKENAELQKQYFIEQINMANELKLPIIIHSRDAYIDTINILKENECKKKGVFHCCQFNLELVRNALGLGYYISLAGPCTFKNSKNADEVIKSIPLDKMLIETDSPYLAPEPFRGTRNDSRNVKIIAEKISTVLDISLEEVAKRTYSNACNLFEI